MTEQILYFVLNTPLNQIFNRPDYASESGIYSGRKCEINRNRLKHA